MTLSFIDLPGIPRLRSGKVRELFDLGADGLLLVATDRISAFDCVLPTPIPRKGSTLTGLSAWWFEQARAALGIKHHLVTADFARFPDRLASFGAQLAGRSMIVRRAAPLPVECVVRGRLAGSGWKEYQQHGTIGDEPAPTGLRLADPLPRPRFTPTSKTEGGHDEGVDWSGFVALLGGDEMLAERLRETSLRLFSFGAQTAAARGLILADTKFEFGRCELTGELLLIDECLTPDSSRFWSAAQTRSGFSPPSFDKQFVRDYLEAINWDKRPPAPELPPEIVACTSTKYLQAYETLIGQPLP